MVGTYIPSTVDFCVHFSKDASNMQLGLVVAEAYKKMKGKVHLFWEGQKNLCNTHYNLEMEYIIIFVST